MPISPYCVLMLVRAAHVAFLSTMQVAGALGRWGGNLQRYNPLMASLQLLLSGGLHDVMLGIIIVPVSCL